MDYPKGGHGGYREGAGRPAAGSDKAAELESFNEARARNESAKASMNELDLKIKQGQYVSREANKAAAAIAVAGVVQALRSLPDNLEREFSLAPEVVEVISLRVDEALAELGKQFKAMAGE